jgi:riboflavin biosynthesis pyrimidine reductase
MLRGPGGSFTTLFDNEQDGLGLPPAFREVYGGDWKIPSPEGRPYAYVNFVVSHDGRVSFGDPRWVGGGWISDFDKHDRWLMGLLRTRADAILVGDGTLRAEPDHLWTADYVFPEDGQAFAELRGAEGRAALPLQVFVSLTGDLPANAAVFAREDLHLVVGTTTAGAVRARQLPYTGRLAVLELGTDRVDLVHLVTRLHTEFGVGTLLCEGGPTTYGSLLSAGVLDDVFITLSPVVVGSPPEGPDRPSLVEGASFTPETAPRIRPLSLRRAGDHLFLRGRCGHD